VSPIGSRFRPSTRANKARYDYNSIHPVLVDPEEERFLVYQQIISLESKFFNAACRKEWKEGAEKLVRLPEVEPGMFRSYLNWVYTGDLAVDVSVADAEETANELKFRGFIELYVLGDTLDDLRLRNSAMKIIVNGNHQLGPKSITWAFENTPTASLMRKQLVRVAATRWSREKYIKQEELYPADFVRALALQLMQLKSDSDRLSHTSFLNMLPEFLEEEVASESVSVA
jgi:hypothetical protein